MLTTSTHTHTDMYMHAYIIIHTYVHIHMPIGFVSRVTCLHIHTNVIAITFCMNFWCACIIHSHVCLFVSVINSYKIILTWPEIHDESIDSMNLSIACVSKVIFDSYYFTACNTYQLTIVEVYDLQHTILLLGGVSINQWACMHACRSQFLKVLVILQSWLNQWSTVAWTYMLQWSCLYCSDHES